jgi:hypothetical protein
MEFEYKMAFFLSVSLNHRIFFFKIHDHVDQQSPWIPARYYVPSASRSKGTAGVCGAFIGRRSGGE